MGHVFRCLNLALGLRERLGIQSHFLMLAHSVETGISRYLSSYNIPLSIVSGQDDYLEDFQRTRDTVEAHEKAFIITDLLSPDPTDRDLLDDERLQFRSVVRYIDKLRELKIPIFSITDEMKMIDLRPNVVIDPACHFPAINYDEIQGTQFYLGPDYYFLGSDFSQFTKKKKAVPADAKKVLIMFGGSDLDGFVMKTAHALHGNSLQVVAVLGPAVPDAANTIAQLKKMGVEVHHVLPSVARQMFNADIAITHGGNTLYEFAAVGTPVISLCRRNRQLRNAEFFQDKGCAINLGLGRHVEEGQIKDAVYDLASNSAQRVKMSFAGRQTVDNKGVERVCDCVKNVLVNRGWRDR